MEDVQNRLKDTSAICLEAHKKWEENKKDKPARESLQEAIHESRKVISRLEIELAISEREEMTSKPIPVPQHRSHNRQPQKPRESSQSQASDSIKKSLEKSRKSPDSSESKSA